MNKLTIYDCSIIYLPKISNRSGNITTVENHSNIPFGVKRIFYLYDIPGGEGRGAHAHKELEQLIIAASGSFDVTMDDGQNKRSIQLNRPHLALHVRPGIWKDISNFSSGAICLVLVSHPYDEDDYIRDYQDFINYKK